MKIGDIDRVLPTDAKAPSPKRNLSPAANALLKAVDATRTHDYLIGDESEDVIDCAVAAFQSVMMRESREENVPTLRREAMAAALRAAARYI